MCAVGFAFALVLGVQGSVLWVISEKVGATKEFQGLRFSLFFVLFLRCVLAYVLWVLLLPSYLRVPNHLSSTPKDAPFRGCTT